VRTTRLWPILVILFGVGTGAGGLYLGSAWLDDREQNQPWTEQELATIRSLWLASLAPLSPDPTNAVADEPDAARLGHRLFFDQRLSSNGQVACSNCHQPERYFTDGLPVSVGVGKVTRNSMTLVGAAYSPWYFWDGRKDSLWSQATGPLENGLEHGSNRLQIARLIAGDSGYRRLYESLFGELPDLTDAERFPQRAGPLPDTVLNSAWEEMTEPDRVAISTIFTNVGKALAAYQRLLMPGPSRFDDYAAEVLTAAAEKVSVDSFSGLERAGLRLFIGRGQCVNCHNGPLFTNNDFHNTGSLSAPGQLPSRGRSAAIHLLMEDPFNCLGAFSDDERHSCAEVRFMKTGDELVGAHRTPSLRNVSRTAPYMHAGQLASLEDVVDQYNNAANSMIGHNEAQPLDLSDSDKEALVAFLGTLDGPIALDPDWLVAGPTQKLPGTR